MGTGIPQHGFLRLPYPNACVFRWFQAANRMVRSLFRKAASPRPLILGNQQREDSMSDATGMGSVWSGTLDGCDENIKIRTNQILP